MAQNKPWLIDPVSPETRQKVTAYKALRGLKTSTGRLHNSLALTQAVERIMHIFAVLWPEVVSQQNLPRYLRAAIITLLANPGTTLVDMYTLLQDQSYRARLLNNAVLDPSVRQFWHMQYDNLGPHERYQRVQPLIGRLEALFMGRNLIRNIVGQQTTINFRQAIEQHQIIFIKLPTKTIPQDAELIGTILLAQIHTAIFSFANVPEPQRPGVSLYVDEFQHFATPDFAELLTEGRKFGARVTVAHQHRSQLPNFLHDSTMTTRTKVCFQVTPEDSREMAHVFPSTEATVQPDDIEVHPMHYLLAHPSNDPVVREFTETYLHPLQGYRRGAGRIKIEAWKIGGPKVFGDYDNLYVSDPTWQLDGLLYEVMQTGNPSLPIPPEVVEGFSNCGRGFYKQAIGIGYNDPLLQADARFPRHLVVQTADGEFRWTRQPDSELEQLYHFVFHLRLVMMRLAEEPIGKATVTSPSEVAKMLTILPKRAAFVRSADTVGTIYTHSTIPAPPRQALYRQIVQVLNHTRAVYCHPREEVERSFLPVDAQLQAPIQPVNRWEEVE
jgi:Type IV secretion-system coupling protein DNA-binding domain